MVYVHNVNEAPYYPSELSYERFIHENSANETSVRGGGVVAVDPDFGDTQILRYSLLGAKRMDNGQMESPRFKLDPVSATLTSTDDLLDYEDLRGWFITISATDGEYDSSVIVAVNVLDINEPPMINVSFSGMSLNENFQPGDKVGTPVIAFDTDGDSLSYDIVSGNDDGVFSIDFTSGQIYVKKGQNPYQVEESVNGHSTGCKNCECLVNSAGRYCQSCNNSQLHQQSYVFGTDCYICPSRTLRRDGKCISNDWLNHGKRTITVQVTDSGSARNGGTPNLFVVRQFILTITPANDPPRMSDITFYMPENSKQDAVVGLVKGEDPENHTLTYNILKGNLDAAFQLDKNTGKITLNNAKTNNFEVNPKYFLTVEVMDNGEGNMTDIAIVTIMLIDVNEKPSIYNCYREVEENRLKDDLVGPPLDAYDVDAKDRLIYTIEDGNEDGMFTIEPLTGQIRAAKEGLNYEERPDYEIKVRVTDRGGLSDTASISILLVDINDPPQMILFPRTLR